MIDLRRLPKAELHLHIEGTLEPELIFTIARRNGVDPGYPSVDALREAYHFTDLQSFLNLYYAGMRVLRTQRDYYDLATGYLERAAAQGVRHAEIFFDPQAHTQRGISFAVVLEGLSAALDSARERHGITSHLILCFLRDLPVESAMATLDQAIPFRDRIVAVGLDSAEIGNPPAKFLTVFDRARAEGFLTVAHAGEEGPPEYVWEALDLLHVSRIDHGVRALEDPQLVERLRRQRVPLTVCPFSNVKLRVVSDLAHHPLKRMLAAGLLATVNSDDPAYFGGYVTANLEGAAVALGLSEHDVITLAKNSFEASFIDDASKRIHLEEIDRMINAARA
ncbi:MAG TPA: adenosine deaminase [Candidatus Baltobacteraceae bacterium]|nr:adenosine deaminase [Candidatus Baltobacteraceae bacterium]